MSINNLYIKAISKTKLAPKCKLSMSGYCVYCADRNWFGGGVMLFVKNIVCHDQFVLPNFVKLETTAVHLYVLVAWYYITQTQ